jgi:antitoxin VapB
VAIRIKNDEAHRMARELALLTGQSMMAAVTEAIRERLNRIQRTREVRLSDGLLAIGKDCAAHLTEPFRSADHAALLYGESGLPR